MRVKCLIKCQNENYFTQILHRKKVNVLELKKVDCNNVIITVDYNDSKIFFAICKNMCYNIKRVWYKGVISPFVNAVKNASIVIGFILFCVTSSFLGDFILQIDYTGTGNTIANQTSFLLEEYGVKKYGKFSSVDFTSLENYLLENSPNLSFVNCKKSGNRLIIESSLGKRENQSISRNGKDIVSDVDGVIIKISVLRGTSLFKVGDSVKNGDILIAGYAVGTNDEKYESFALGYAIVSYEYKQDFIEKNTSIENINKIKKILAFQFEDEIVNEQVEMIDGGFSIKLTLNRYIGG